MKKLYCIWKFLFSYIKKSHSFKEFLVALFLLAVNLFLFIPIPSLLGQTTNLLNTHASYSTLGAFGTNIILLLTLYILRYILVSYGKGKFVRIEKQVVTEVRSDLVQKYLKLPLDYIMASEKGAWLSKIEESSQLGQILSASFIGIALNVFELLFSLIIIFHIKKEVLIILACFFPLYYFLLKRISSPIGKSTSALLQATGVLSSKTFSAINNIREIKINNAYDYIDHVIKEATNEYVNSSYRQSRLVNLYGEKILLASNLINVGITLFCGALIFCSRMSFSEYIILSAYISKSLGYIQGFASMRSVIEPTYVVLTRVKSFLDYQEETQEGQNIENCRSVEFEKVNFNYPGKENKVIKNLSFSLNEGEILHITGKNGTGKTTLTELLIGLFAPTSGRILINGIPIQDINISSLRKRIGVVSQDVVLFNDTIANNILLGSDKEKGKVMKLISDLEFEGFFDAFEDGLDTVLCNGSISVSGGEAKIISLLRALVQERDVVILDEVTAGLDSGWVCKVLEKIKEHKIGKTLIIISHDSNMDVFGHVLNLD